MKNSSINKFLDEFVLSKLSSELKSSGFKLKKTESKLNLTKNGYSLVYWLYRSRYRFIWDESSGNAFITFSLFTHIKFPVYNKWYKKQFDKIVDVEQFIKKDYLYLKLDKNIYNQNDFSEKAGTPVIIENDFEHTGIHRYEIEKHFEFNNNFIESLKINSNIIETNIDLSFITERKGLPLEYVCLPHFYNNAELANELFDKHYQLRINYINDKIGKGQSEEQIKRYINDLDYFIRVSKDLIKKEYNNPYMNE